MKTKRTVISIFTLCTALLFTACSGKGTSNTEASRDTQTEAGTEVSGSSTLRWMIYISRRISSLLIMKMHGTKHLA